MLMHWVIYDIVIKSYNMLKLDSFEDIELPKPGIQDQVTIIKPSHFFINSYSLIDSDVKNVFFYDYFIVKMATLSKTELKT